MESKIKLLKSQLGEHRVKENIDISAELHSKMGGVVAGFYLATSTAELITAVTLCRELKIDFLMLGSGSKVALSDLGFTGVVIKNRCDNIKIAGVKGNVSREGIGVARALIEAESGISLIGLVKFAQQHQLDGLEALSQVPGTIGGSLMVNRTLQESCTQLKVLDLVNEVKTKALNQLSREDIILSAVFELKANRPENSD